MKKEDLCMLLIVVALVLIISRNTKIFEGMDNIEFPPGMSEEEMDELREMIESDTVPMAKQVLSPTKPAMAPNPAKPAMRPKPAMPPKPAMRS